VDNKKDILDYSNQLELGFTGSQINYYFVCKRKLWLFSHNIELESNSDLVLLGKILHERSYRRKSRKEVDVERIKIDFVDNTNEIHEVKRSRKIENAHIYQLLYYLYFLKKYANKQSRGVLNYPLLKKKVYINLTPEKEIEMEKILSDVSQIVHQTKPPDPEWKSYCKNCAYCELCWG
jgi:CRISPR-associated exonuclease Cas4